MPALVAELVVLATSYDTGRTKTEVAVAEVVAALVVVVVREVAVPSSPRWWSRWSACSRWWCWSPIAAVAVAGVLAVLAVVALDVAHQLGGGGRLVHCGGGGTGRFRPGSETRLRTLRPRKAF